MHRKTIYLIMFAALLIYAQGNKTQNQFSGFNKGYFSGYYSMFPTFIDEINEEVSDFGVDKFDKYIFLYGGELCGNINPAFGIGIQYFTGSAQSQNITEFNIDSSLVKLDRSVKYNINFLGLVTTYRKSLYGAFEFFGSLSAGYGSIEIILSQDYGDQSFGDLWDSFDPESYLNDYNRSFDYNSDLFIFSANNGVRIFVSSRIALGISVGYCYGFVLDKGELNYGFESVRNVPDLDFEGMNYGIGVYFGY